MPTPSRLSTTRIPFYVKRLDSVNHLLAKQPGQKAENGTESRRFPVFQLCLGSKVLKREVEDATCCEKHDKTDDGRIRRKPFVTDKPGDGTQGNQEEEHCDGLPAAF